MRHERKQTIALAMTGASGAVYGLRLLECLIQAGRCVHFVASAPAQIVVGMEMDFKLPNRASDARRLLAERYHAQEGQLQVFGRDEWTAPLASGSNPPDAMVVCPCSSGTLSAIACGASKNLIERGADVMLKERRKLILVHRETPVSTIQLENMLRLSQAGAVIMPANPGFYNNPSSLSDLVDFMVARILDQLGIEHKLTPRWGEGGLE